MLNTLPHYASAKTRLELPFLVPTEHFTEWKVYFSSVFNQFVLVMKLISFLTSRAVFREDTMASALNDGIRMYMLDTSGPEKYFPVKKEELEVCL